MEVNSYSVLFILRYFQLNIKHANDSLLVSVEPKLTSDSTGSAEMINVYILIDTGYVQRHWMNKRYSKRKWRECLTEMFQFLYFELDP